MKQNSQTIDLPAQLTQQLRQPPEESLRVISNYSSLQRMSNRVNNNKIFGIGNIVKKDSFGIGAWVTSARERKDNMSRSCCSKSKFATVDYSRIVPSLNTMSIGSESTQLRTRTLSPRKQSKNRGQTIRGTNFKYSTRTQRSYQFRTVPHHHKQSLKISMHRQKKKWQQTFYKQAVKRRIQRQMLWPTNPQCQTIPTTSYPTMTQGKLDNPRNKYIRKYKIVNQFGV